MENNDLISESEAAEIAGISMNTLLRFVESGCLRTAGHTNGVRMFSKPELEGLFGITVPQPPAQPKPSPAQTLQERIEKVVLPEIEAEQPKPTDPTPDEAIKYKAIAEMQERLLDMKDKEIERLTTDLQWHKERIHRLEDKADRDQILLMTETQMITKLIEHQEKKKGGVRKALGWLGFSGGE